MKDLQAIADKIEVIGKTNIGKAQLTVLDALNVECETFAHAESFFNAIGITVIAKRVGNKSVPQVYLNDEEKGQFNYYGEGESASDLIDPIIIKNLLCAIIKDNY